MRILLSVSIPNGPFFIQNIFSMQDNSVVWIAAKKLSLKLLHSWSKSISHITLLKYYPRQTQITVFFVMYVG